MYISKLFLKTDTGELEKKEPQFVRIRKKETAKNYVQHSFSPAAKNVARPKSHVAGRATSLAAAVAQNGYFDANAAPAQPRNSELLPCCA